MGQRWFSLSKQKATDRGPEACCKSRPLPMICNTFASTLSPRHGFYSQKTIKKSLIESERRIQCCWLTKPDALMASVASGKKLTKKNIEKTGSEPFGNWFGTICTFTWNSVEFNVSKWNSRVSSPPPPPGPFTLPSRSTRSTCRRVITERRSENYVTGDFLHFDTRANEARDDLIR